MSGIKHDPSTAIESPRDYDRLHTALQLLVEAYDLQVNPESRVDYRDWKRAARSLLDAHGLVTHDDEQKKNVHPRRPGE